MHPCSTFITLRLYQCDVDCGILDYDTVESVTAITAFRGNLMLLYSGIPLKSW